ncbi:DUF368 domain-containing protein [Fundicoccus sp. Sow4_D5]|uniref:DUF368 domain-containing protein n=1 Tax=unclassified Fundicoccus TaxID=2761543 RepID=UPI003F912D0E
MKESTSQNWILRFVKGMFIGSGFILPGVSGGALAAIFGIYERIIRFLANITKNFKDDVLFFIPVGLGALTGIVILSFGVSFLLGNFETIILWFFVGCIVGTAPSLWKEAGKQGRSQKDYLILGVSFLLGLVLLYLGKQSFSGAIEPSFIAWFISGALIALGILVPGLSPSNFIVYMGLYTAMADGFKTLDFSVIIPIGIGGLVTVLLLSKAIELIFERYYSYFFHFIVGIVLASTLMIIPVNYVGFTVIEYLLCAVMLIMGTLLGKWMATLEEKYK